MQSKIGYLFLGIVLVVLLGGMVVKDYIRINDGKLHVVFCNVGQGDAIFIRTPAGKDILVDGGPDNAVLSCLSRHMPFWDRTIDLVLLSHPHADHLQGLIEVVGQYAVASFATEELTNQTAGYAALETILGQKKIHKQLLIAGNRVKFSDGVILAIVGPTKTFLDTTSPSGKIGESSEFASVLQLVSYGNFQLLLTGDSQKEELQETINLGFFTKRLTVLQMPHHGSKTGITDSILARLAPQVAVVSVGKNKYGHPHPEVIEKLNNKDIRILRTDKNGDIEIVSDGKGWEVR